MQLPKKKEISEDNPLQPPKKRPQKKNPADPQSKKRTPKDNLAEYGMQLLNDAENSRNPELVRLRIEIIDKLFDAHLKASAPVSPRMALYITIPALAALALISIYTAMTQTQAVYISVTSVAILFALIFIVFMLALCGKMSDTVTGKLISGMFEKVVTRFWKSKPRDEE